MRALPDPEFESFVAEARAGAFETALQICGFVPAKGGARIKEQYGPCPGCGGSNRFSVSVAARAAGCRHCRFRTRGDALRLALLGERIDFIGACEALARRAKPERLGAETAEQKAAREERRRVREAEAALERDNQAAAQRLAEQKSTGWACVLWARGCDWPGSDGERYLTHRGILSGDAAQDQAALASISNLRLHPALEYFHDSARLHCGPALLARIQAPEGRMIGVQRIWIDPGFATPKGRPVLLDPATGEALVTKKTAGLVQGGAIRLIRGVRWAGGINSGFPGDLIPPRRLFLAEGVETCLTVWRALQASGSPLLEGAAFWAAAGLHNMAVIPPPASIDAVVMLGDGDSDPDVTGRVLRQAQDRHRAAGLRSLIVMAPTGQDFNDLAREAA